MKLTYNADKDGICYLDLTAPSNNRQDIGTWGRMRLRYLKEHRPGLYAVLRIQGVLFTHLTVINEQAKKHFDLTVARMMKTQGVDEDMKARDQKAWVEAVNNIMAMTREIVVDELIHS